MLLDVVPATSKDYKFTMQFLLNGKQRLCYKVLQLVAWMHTIVKKNKMKRKSYDTVSEAMVDLKKLGYTIDFSILAEKECLICHLTSTVLSPDDFRIDQFFRFEGDSDPGDEMIVYAISSIHDDIKGIVVNAFGIYADNATSLIVKKLNTHPTH